MEALKLNRKGERSQLTRLLNRIEAALSEDIVMEDQICVINERLNRFYPELRATDFDIVLLLSTTEAEAEFGGLLKYSDQATATSATLK
ncbi:hypothetical protein MTO96_016061 [Rhipicephalus appendiculatus]